MYTYVLIFLAVNALALLLMPRRLVPLAFLIGACFIPNPAFQIQIGSLHFSAIRILISTGMLRMLIRGERLSNRANSIDWLMAVWALWAIASSFFYTNLSAALISRLGLVYDTCGIYFIFRVFCHSLDDVDWLCRATAILLVPVALEMVYEKVTISNLFYESIGSQIGLYIRQGHVRAQGPFGHSILAGTVGAVCLPLVIPLWFKNRKIAAIGIGACLSIVITSASSGPILSTIFAVAALVMYRHRNRTRLVLWLLVVGYIALDFIMKDPAYFILSRIDIAGGSTGWHRAMLIQSALENISEWWLYGTDYTRHWMPSGVPWSENHTDITNHYLKMGVIGGLPLMLLFITILARGFFFVGKMLRQMPVLSQQSQLMIWGLGASLFTHAVSIMGVSYFDQSFVFLSLTLAAISSVHSERIGEAELVNNHSGSHVRITPATPSQTVVL
jgi:hypothetical protein